MEPLFISVRDACERTNLGKTTIYRLLGEGQIDSILVGTRRLILLRSVSNLTGRTREEPDNDNF